MAKTKDLVEIIRANPGCVAIVDNDCWQLYKRDPFDVPEGVDEDKWSRQNELANDSNVTPRGDGYGSGCTYGGDLLQALAVIVGIKVQSV